MKSCFYRCNLRKVMGFRSIARNEAPETRTGRMARLTEESQVACVASPSEGFDAPLFTQIR